MIGFAPPIIYGRGVFWKDFGFLPHRRPVTSVVGAPIPVEATPNPTDEQVDKIHKQYVDALKKLFDDQKDKYGAKELTFVR